MGLRDNLELMLQRGQDSPLLRFSLGNECLKAGDHLAAIDHLRKAVEHKPDYSAAWKLLGQAYADSGAIARAIEVYGQGIESAVAQGDVQAAKEMSVFLRRLKRSRQPGS